jgi:hypothetical protein
MLSISFVTEALDFQHLQSLNAVFSDPAKGTIVQPNTAIEIRRTDNEIILTIVVPGYAAQPPQNVAIPPGPTSSRASADLKAIAAA